MILQIRPNSGLILKIRPNARRHLKNLFKLGFRPEFDLRAKYDPFFSSHPLCLKDTPLDLRL